MKHLKKFLTLVLISLIGLLLITCQKEDQIMLSSDTDTEIDMPQLKSALILTPEYLFDLIDVIQSMIDEGALNKGNGNALIKKIENALKSLDNGNENAAANQIDALINQIDEFTINGTLTVEEGETLITVLKEGIEEEGETEGTFVDGRDDHEYGWIKIGKQIWMTENLAFDIGEGCWAYNNDENYVATYGRLYNWDAANLACPEGWRLPTRTEWTELSSYLINKGYGYEGSGDDIAKSLAATTNWKTSLIAGTPGNDLDSNNSSRFSGLPAGQFNIDTKNFHNIGERTYWWSSTESGTITNANAWSLYYNTNGFASGYPLKAHGLSIRCIKD